MTRVEASIAAVVKRSALRMNHVSNRINSFLEEKMLHSRITSEPKLGEADVRGA